jgi:hypothetical protein
VILYDDDLEAIREDASLDDLFEFRALPLSRRGRQSQSERYRVHPGGAYAVLSKDS